MAHAVNPLRVFFLIESTLPGTAVSTVARACFTGVTDLAAWAEERKSIEPAATAAIEPVAMIRRVLRFMMSFA
jgi:hypothetical protein